MDAALVGGTVSDKVREALVEAGDILARFACHVSTVEDNGRASRLYPRLRALAALSSEESAPEANPGSLRPDYDRSIHSNPDARAWAAFFAQHFPPGSPCPDEGTMLGWFANAMMAMHDSLKAAPVPPPPPSPEPSEVPEEVRSALDSYRDLCRDFALAWSQDTVGSAPLKEDERLGRAALESAILAYGRREREGRGRT
jgi:hypothetical protein